MPFNIDTFKTNIGSGGYLTTNKFNVIVTPPLALMNNLVNGSGLVETSQAMSDLIRFRAEAIRVPGVTLLTADVNRYGAGPTQKQPYSAQFNDNGITLLSDGYGDIWQFWHNWLKFIFNFTGTSDTTVDLPNQIPTYTSQYKSDFSTTIQIIVYDQTGNAIQTINMFEAFPTSIRDVPLNWADSGNLIRLDIGLAFTDYTIDYSSSL